MSQTDDDQLWDTYNLHIETCQQCKKQYQLSARDPGRLSQLS